MISNAKKAGVDINQEALDIKPYIVNITNQENTKKIMKESNLIYCVLIDGESEKIQGIKLFNFPLDIFEKLTSVWEKAFENNNYTEDFKAYMTNFFSEDISFWWENIN